MDAKPQAVAQVEARRACPAELRQAVAEPVRRSWRTLQLELLPDIGVDATGVADPR